MRAKTAGHKGSSFDQSLPHADSVDPTCFSQPRLDEIPFALLAILCDHFGMALHPRTSATADTKVTQL